MPAELEIPESPYGMSGMGVEEVRGEASSSSSSRKWYTSQYTTAPTLRFLSNPTPSSISELLRQPLSAQDSHSSNGKGKGRELDESRDSGSRTRFVLQQTLRYALERADTDLVGWLCSLGDEWGDILDGIVAELEDDDGWGVTGMAISGSCGRQEKEEAVRAVVGRWGLGAGPREGRDHAGWTPLHLAAIISTPPLISFLLAKGASTELVSKRGLTPLDLVSGMETREDVAMMLEHTTDTFRSEPAISSRRSSPSGVASLSQARQAMLRRKRTLATQRQERMERAERKRKLQDEQERWLRERAKCVDIDVGLLLPPTRRGSRWSADSGVAFEQDDIVEDEDEEDQGDDEDHQERNDYSAMLVFSLSNLPGILDTFITNYSPQTQPLARRSLPANALHRYAKFAHYRCDETWLAELMDGVIERIEEGAFGNMENLAYLAFWAYNTTLLLHLIRADEGLAIACDDLGYLTELEGLIHAIHVFVIRMAERRIDSLLDAALLDYEILEEVGDVKFEGEWNLFRPLTIRKKRETMPKVSSLFPQAGGNENVTPPSASLFSSLRDGSPFKSPGRPQSLQEFRASISHDSLSTIGQSMADPVNPSKITDILSGVLLVLQLYEVNPAITVQAFSQIFYWIACELFNRILSRKKYLCRTKAIQIRMNITVLDDWIRSNGLPAKTATKHLEPVTQLLQWLQCLSQVNEFDTLIGTMQSLKAINPLQMRRAVRDYRYEVNEGRMTDECGQYLAQLQKDWEKRRVQLGHQQMKAASEPCDITEDGSIDTLFDGSTSLADWVPQSAPECLGELLDTRYMIPFLLPTNNDYLVATPPVDIAFQGLVPSSPFISDSLSSSSMSRPTSRSSFSTSRPMGYLLPSPAKLRRLPDDFFPWLKDRETERRLKRDTIRHKQKNLVPAATSPLGPSQKMNIPSGNARPTAIRIKTSMRSDLDIDGDDVKTPLATSASQPLRAGAGGYPFPSPGLSTSNSMDELRASAKSRITSSEFEPVPVVYTRTDSYELSVRTPPGSSFRSNGSTFNSYDRQPQTPTGKKGTATSFASMSMLTSPFDLGRKGSPVLSPESAGAGGSTGKKSWWSSLGRSGGSSSGDGEERPVRREGSDDTIRSRLWG